METNDRSQLRVGYAEREETVRLISEAHSLGQLDVDEFEERVSAAHAARTRGDLDALTADLPVATRRAARSAQPSGPSLSTGRRSCGGAQWWKVAAVVAMVWLAVSMIAGLFWSGYDHGSRHDGPPVFLFVALAIAGVIVMKRRRHRRTTV